MRRVYTLWGLFLAVWAGTFVWYGGVSPEAVASAAAALALLNLVAAGLFPEPLKLSRSSLVFLAGGAGVFLLQLLPLDFLFPVTAELRTGHGAGTGPGTADTFLTVRVLAQVLAYALSATLILRLRREGLALTTAIQGLLAILGLEAVHACVQVFSGQALIPFYDGPTSAPRAATGTLVGRNTFAGLMAMALVLAVTIAYRRFLWPARREGDHRPTAGRRIEAGLPWALLAGLFAVAIVLTKSRGGALAAVGGLVALPFLFRGRASGPAAIALVLIAVVAVLVANPAGLLARFEKLDPFEIDDDTRWTLWTQTFDAAMRQPVLGFGMGTHPQAFHPFQPPDLPGQVHHAHNEYVNVLFEAGVAGLALLLFGLGAWAWRVWRGHLDRPGPDRLPVTAILAAVACEALHMIVDFDLRVTSIGIFFGALLGLGSSVCRHGAAPRRATWLLPAAGLAAAAALAFLPLAPELREDTTSALRLSPYDHPTSWLHARRAQRSGDKELADDRFRRAASLFPPHPDLQLDAGLWFWVRFRETGDPAHRDRAAECLHRLFRQKPEDVEQVLSAVWEDRPLEDYEALLPDVGRAWAGLAAFLVARGDWQRAGRVFARGCPPEPENVAAFDHYARALHAAGQWGLEARILEERLKLASDGEAYARAARAWLALGAHERGLERVATAIMIEPMEAAHWALKAEILTAAGRLPEAMEALYSASARDRGSVRHLVKLAELHEAQDMHAAAADDYRDARRLRPDDRGLVLKLARALQASGDLPAARRELDLWLRRHPDDEAVTRARERLK